MTACCIPSKLPIRTGGFWQDCTCAVFGGLLCSSCCIIQLLLNSLSVGCAGFASLSSYRPAFLSITTATLIGNYWLYRNKRRTALAVAVAFGLTITPELVHLFNEDRILRLPHFSRYTQESNASQAAGIPFHVEGMKCLACCARVKQHVLATTGAESCQVDFEGATVTVQGAGVSKETIVSSLATLGYVATPIAKMLGAGEAYQEQKP